MAEPDTQHARIAELDELLEKVYPHYIRLSPQGTLYDPEIQNQKTKELAAKKIDALKKAGVTEDDNHLKALALVRDRGLDAYIGENKGELIALAETDRNIRMSLQALVSKAWEMSVVPTKNIHLNAIINGMKGAAQELAIRPSWEHPACHVEGSEGLEMSGSCLPPAPRERKAARR